VELVANNLTVALHDHVILKTLNACFNALLDDLPRCIKNSKNSFKFQRKAVTMWKRAIPFLFFGEFTGRQRHLHVLQKWQRHLQPLVQRHRTWERRNKTTRLPPWKASLSCWSSDGPRTQKSNSVDLSTSSSRVKVSFIQICFRSLLALKLDSLLYVNAFIEASYEASWSIQWICRVKPLSSDLLGYFSSNSSESGVFCCRIQLHEIVKAWYTLPTFSFIIHPENCEL